MREAVGGLSVGTCSVDRGRGAHIRIWGVTGPRKWLHLFNSCCIFFFTRSPVICVKICHLLWGQVEVEVGHFLSNVALCAWQHLAGHLKWQMSKTVKVNCCHHKTCHQIITLWPPMAITSRGGFASFSAAGGILGGVLPDPGKSQSFLDNLTFSRLTGGLQPKLVSAGWVLGLGRNCPPVAAALTHWARTRGLWQRSHHWRPQRPTTTHHPPRRCSAGAQHPCPGGNPRKWVGIEHKPTPLEKQSWGTQLRKNGSASR